MTDGDSHISFKDQNGFPVFIDCYGGGQRKIVVNGVMQYFSWSDRFGPIPETKKGRGKDLSWDHPFWLASSYWGLQGKRVADGICIWHVPRKPVYEIKGRTIVKVIDPGEEGHNWDEPDRSVLKQRPKKQRAPSSTG